MKLYKLTEGNETTQNNTKWGEGVEHTKPKKNTYELCSGDVLHAYKNKNLAFLLNPVHANIKNPLLWECVGDVVVEDFGKVGCIRLKTKKQIKVPAWVGTKKEKLIRVAFAVLCAEAVIDVYEKHSNNPAPRKAIEAAKQYLKNPTTFSAYAADAAADAAYVAAYAADAADAARAAAYAAAYAAAFSAYAAYAADAAYAAAYAAPDAAAYAADAAAYAARVIDFCELANKAVEYVK